MQTVHRPRRGYGCRLTLLIAALLLAVSALAQERPAVRLLAEAEDFTPQGPGWQVVPFRENYFASTFAISFLSRMACLGAPEQLPAGQTAVAEQVVEIPYADEYQVLARYEQPFNFAVEFTVEIVQGGKPVYQQVFGRLQDPKVWALNGHHRVPMERFWWGGTDNIVWQQPGAAKLAAGPATIRLIAGAQVEMAQPRVNAARRNVDVICLTNDTAGIAAQTKTRYLEFDGWLVQDGDLFVRFINPQDGLGPCLPVVTACGAGQHSPYYVHVRDWPSTRVLKSGRLTDPTTYRLAGPRSQAVNPNLLTPELDRAKFMVGDPQKPAAAKTLTIPDTEYLQPGDQTGWVPVGQVLDALHNCLWFPTAQYKVKTDQLYLTLEFAVPDGKGGLRPVRTVTVKGKPGYYSPATFEMPGNVAPNPAVAKALKERFWLPEIRTQAEALAWLDREVTKAPKRGPTPQRFLIYNIMGFSGAVDAFPEARQLALDLGDNTAVGQAGKKRGLVTHWPNTSQAFLEKQKLDDIHAVSYGDETHLPPAPVKDEDFAAWLTAHGVTAPGPVKFDTKDRTNPLYYYSMVCGIEAGAKPYIAASAYYAARGTLTGANYSPHANYLVTELHYLRPFKLQALTMPWSEDYVWQIPEFSVQVVGYLTSAFRAGAKYHQQPIHMYVMPHSPGNTPRDFRLSFYTTVAHGAKMINYFCASPLAVGGTENYVATDDVPMWREISNCSHEAGVFEDYVMDGAVRPARVGLLLSSVDEVLTGVSNATLAMHNNERKAIYYALRHSQVPVDFLSEDDVIDGLAKDYQVIYLTQQWVHSKALAALLAWAKAGGTVVALCGGGFRNEFDQPNPLAAELYGVKNQQLTTDPQLVPKYLLGENRPFLTKQDLPLYEPMDLVNWKGEGAAPREVKAVPVVVWKQTLEPGDGRVIGTFRDGKPAVIAKTHGRGSAVLFGFLPGQGYLKSGLPVRPADRGSTDAGFSHFLPTGMDVNLRQALVDDFLPAGFARPVVCSETLVESAIIVTPALNGKPARLAVPLMNYTGQPLAKLTVKVTGLAKAAAVRSVLQPKLTPQYQDGALTVELPLAVSDMLLIDQ